VEAGSLETMLALASDGLVKNEPEQGFVMAKHNAHQVADWNDQSGERWVAHQARLDARLAVFGQAAIEAAAPRGRVARILTAAGFTDRVVFKVSPHVMRC
jgi:hypothetical protein